MSVLLLFVLFYVYIIRMIDLRCYHFECEYIQGGSPMRSIMKKYVSEEYAYDMVRDIISNIENMTIVDVAMKANRQLRTNNYITRSIDSMGNTHYNWGGGITPFYNVVIKEESISIRIKTSKGCYEMDIHEEGFIVIASNGSFDKSVRTIMANVIPAYYWNDIDINDMDIVNISNLNDTRISLVSGSISKDTFKRGIVYRDGDVVKFILNNDKFSLNTLAA